MESKKSHLPEFISPSEIYPISSLPFHDSRYSSLKSDFLSKYGVLPSYIARAPGRVNLIGEHIDYMGYGVLPFALEQDTLIAFLSNDSDSLEINHVDPSKYPSITLSNNPLEIPKDTKAYYNYLLAGYRSVMIPMMSLIKSPKGIKILITGNVPIASGLSSSAAMVVCSAVMTVFANDLNNKINLNSFTENTIEYERKLGTAIGGMDQTISIMGETNKALYIQFNPIRTEDVPLPKNICFIIANSLTESKKMMTLGTRYNKRVCECRLALILIMKKLGINKQINNLSELQNELGFNFEKMKQIVENNLKKGGYNKEEIENLLQNTLVNTLKDINHYDIVLEQNKEFFLQERAVHVYSEAERVLQFKEICNKNISNEEKIPLLGKLMDESHVSCRDLYDCSSEKLDILVSLCKKNGAIGSRLTGAGWGGCTVSMVNSKDADNFIKIIKNEFYSDVENVDEYLFKSEIGKGAGVLKLV